MISSDPLYHNLFWGLFLLVYIRVIVAFCDWMVRRNHFSFLQARKVIHMSATCLLMYWPLFDDTHWSYRFNSITAVLYCFQLVGQALLFPNPDDPEVKSMTRTGDPKELLYGPLLFGSVLAYVGLFEFRKEMATYLMASMGFGDGLAPIFGQLGYGRYRTYGGETKTMSGSMAMFVGTIVGAIILQRVLGAPEELQMERVVGMAATAAAVEAASGMFDNIAVALSVALYVKATANGMR